MISPADFPAASPNSSHLTGLTRLTGLN